MYIMTRYVTWEVLKFFLAALIALTLMFTLGMGVKEGFNKGLPAVVMMRTMPLMLPEILGITIPVAMLFAVSSVFGRMTGNNEVMALKSLGINPMAVVWPALVLAAFLSLGAVWMYETSATWCKPGIQRVIAESLEEIAYSMLRKNRSFGSESDPFTITVKRVDERTLIQPTITINSRPGQPRVMLTAAEAELRTDWQARTLHIICRQGEVDIEGQMRMAFPGTEQYSVPIVEPGRPRYHRDWVAMRDIPDLIVELETKKTELQTQQRRLQMLRDASVALGLPDSSEDIDRLEAEINENQRLILRLKTEPYRRWSNGFTCLCFALIGTPVAMLWRHADVLTNFFVCFLPILVVYYPLLMLGEDLSTSGKLPPISFWMGNVILAIPAVMLLRRIIKR